MICVQEANSETYLKLRLASPVYLVNTLASLDHHIVCYVNLGHFPPLKMQVNVLCALLGNLRTNLAPQFVPYVLEGDI